MTCRKTQEFLAKEKIQTAETVNAKKNTVSAARALALAREVDEIVATRGKHVIHLDLRKEKPDAETLKRLLIGPSGNLRAPTLRIGKTLLVGFDEESYRKLLA
jgi:arsenate reductase-like glutaredoxin family protein